MVALTIANSEDLETVVVGASSQVEVTTPCAGNESDHPTKHIVSSLSDGLAETFTAVTNTFTLRSSYVQDLQQQRITVTAGHNGVAKLNNANDVKFDAEL